MSEIHDETLMALADDALSLPEAERIRAFIAASPELAERYARFVETRFLLEGVQDAAVTAPKGPQTRWSPQRSLRRPEVFSARHRGGLALAAALALAIGLMGGVLLDRYVRASDATGQFEASSTPEARQAIARALNAAPSGAIVPFGQEGARQAGRVAMISSHRLSNGEVCRQYEVGSSRYDVSPETLLSCRVGDGVWRKRVAIFREANASFAPATGPDDVTPLVALVGGGSLLTPVEEAAMLGSR